MVNIPHAQMPYGREDLLNALEKYGYSRNDAELLLLYGGMTVMELRSVVSGGTTLLSGIADDQLRSIFSKAEQKKKVHDRHVETIDKAQLYISRYTEEVQEFVREMRPVKALAESYYADSPTGRSLTREEALLLAARKFLVLQEGAAQLQEKRSRGLPAYPDAPSFPVANEPEDRAMKDAEPDNPLEYGRLLCTRGYSPADRLRMLKETFPYLTTHELGGYARGIVVDDANKDACRQWYKNNKKK